MEINNLREYQIYYFTSIGNHFCYRINHYNISDIPNFPIKFFYKQIDFFQKQFNNPMKKRINFQLFKQNQTRVQLKSNPLQQQLYKTSSQLINDLLCDIKRPFNNICIHGFYPQHIIQYLTNHRKQFPQTLPTKSAQSQKPTITIIDYLGLPQSISLDNDIFSQKILALESSDTFPPEQEQFDLIISNMQLAHTNSEEKLLEKYLRTLKPDGALLGCTMAQGTLSELHWSYLMAENQRHGGLSPKIMNFPSLGQLGNLLTTAHFHLTTVLNRDFHLEFESPLDVIKAVKELGESGHLRGRRKAAYKELLVVAYAMYQSEFQLIGQENVLSSTNQTVQTKLNPRVLSTLVLAPFVGWKYAPNQPKPLRRGQHGDSIDFIDQLRKHDPDLQHFRITEDSEQPQQINRQKRQKNNNTCKDNDKKDN